MQKIFKILTALCVFISMAQAKQFVSLNLCSDRLLAALARPEQIAAQSPYAKNPLMMLDKIYLDKPSVEPQLSQLLPYLDKTILINENFYPQLVANLKKLGVKIIPINEDPKTQEQLFSLILNLGKHLENEQSAVKLVENLRKIKVNLASPRKGSIFLSDTGFIEPLFPQYQILLDLLGLTPVQYPLTTQNFSFEKLLLSEPNWLILLTDKNGYNTQAQWLEHPLLQQMFKPKSQASIPLKYTYCLDHGVWQGAELIYQQLKNH